MVAPGVLVENVLFAINLPPSGETLGVAAVANVRHNLHPVCVRSRIGEISARSETDGAQGAASFHDFGFVVALDIDDAALIPERVPGVFFRFTAVNVKVIAPDQRDGIEALFVRPLGGGKDVEPSGDVPASCQVERVNRIERLVGKKEFPVLMKDLFVKPQGNPTLVLDTDARPEYKRVEQAKKDFSDN